MDTNVFQPLLDAVCGGIRKKNARQAAKDELLDHLISESEVQMACGLSEEAAAAAVIQAFGDPAQIRRALRQVHRAENRRVLLNGLAIVFALVLCFGMLHLASLFCFLGYDYPDLILIQDIAWILMLLGLLRAIRGRSIALSLIIFFCALSYVMYAAAPAVLMPLMEWSAGNLLPFMTDLVINTLKASGAGLALQIGWVAVFALAAFLIVIRNCNFYDQRRSGRPALRRILQSLLLSGIMIAAASFAVTAYGYHSIRGSEAMQIRHESTNDFQIVLAPNEAEADRLLSELKRLPYIIELQDLVQNSINQTQPSDVFVYLFSYHHDLGSASFYVKDSFPDESDVTIEESVLIPRDAFYSIEISRATIPVPQKSGVIGWKLEYDDFKQILPLPLETPVTLRGHQNNHPYEIVLQPEAQTSAP